MLKELFVTLPTADNEWDLVVAARIKLPEGESVGWDTVIKFDDGISGFATVDKKPFDLQSGRKIEDCYRISSGDKSRFLKKGKAVGIVLYAYRNKCFGGVGTAFPFFDKESGECKILGTHWKYTIMIVNCKALIEHISATQNHSITAYECSKYLRNLEEAALDKLLCGVLLQKLKTIHYTDIREHCDEISDLINEQFINQGGMTCSGLQPIGFSCEGIILNGKPM